MTVHHLALLLGLFAVPIVSLAIGFRFRKHGPRARAIFWGAIIGHTIATIVASVAAIWPPRVPGPDDDLRMALILWTLLLGGVLGAAIALIRQALRDRSADRGVSIVHVLLAPIATAAMLAACTMDAATNEPLEVPIGAVDTLTTPAAPGSRESDLSVGPDGRLLMTWMEPRANDGYALRLAMLERDAGAFAQPVTVTSGRRFFVNWADFPSAIALPDGRLAAHWLERSADGTYEYDVRIAQSTDGGQTWSDGLIPHRDGTRSEHGFVTLYDAGRALLGAVWLDGRKFAGASPTREMTLAHTTLAADGTLGPEQLIDERICDCCQTSGAITSRGPVLVYRDRSPGEIRDISIVRFANGRWTEPRPVHTDGWEVHHCPVNGPAADAEGDVVVVAWYTEAPDTSVNLAFSRDAGATFGAPVRIDGGMPLGRVDVELIGRDLAAVTWMERGERGAEVRLRAVSTTGRKSEPRVIGQSSGSRAAGFPRMARQGDRLVFAWTETGRPSSVVVTTTILRQVGGGS